MRLDIHMSNFMRLYTLNVCNLLYANHTSIKCLKKKKKMTLEIKEAEEEQVWRKR